MRHLLILLVIALASAAERQNAPFPAPTQLWAAQTSPTDITLVWQPVPGALTYRLYAHRDGADRQVGTTRATGNRFIQRVTAVGVPHIYAIEAVAENGTVSPRVRFNEVVPVEAVPGPVAAPASVTATADPSGTVVVRWTAVPGATAYMVGRAVSPGGYRMICSLCPGNSTTYVDSATTAGAKHSYTVVALTPRGASRATRSGEAVAAAPAPPARPTATPAPVAKTIEVKPAPGSCLALGEEGNFIVRLADGTVQIFERVQFRRRGPTFAKAPKLEPVAGITDAVAVSTSGSHWLVLRANGTILSWGLNGSGQLGAEEAIDRRFGRALPRPIETPTPVREITSAVAIAAGADHSVAVLADGTVRTWGTGLYGVPGDGVFELSSVAATPRLSPTRVVEIDNATRVAASGHFTLALLADGTLRAWGYNEMAFSTRGALGTGNDESTAVPRPVVGISNAIGITAGIAGVGAAVLADGTVRAWGYGWGRSTAPNAANTPIVVEGIRTAVAISPFMALLRDGTVKEFPAGSRWSTPPLSNVVAVASDHVNRIALLADGKLLAWGHKRFYPDGPVVRGQLGAETAAQCAASGLTPR